ncbi:hypothetical protein LSAT2_001957 [Lamellibrachia satsuma]|nr:hypothetical protein LSAT2_001957 [Lamellibrachia satsuma]
MAADLVSNNRITIDPDVKMMLETGGVKHRAHPGIMQVKKVKLPERLLKSVNLLVEKYPVSKLKEKSAQLVRYLQSRQLPLENDELKYKTQQIHQKVVAHDNVDTTSLTEIEMEQLEKKWKDKTVSQLNKSVYHWKTIQYNASKGFLYLIGRLANDYSVMYRIFSEVSMSTGIHANTLDQHVHWYMPTL